MRVPLTYIITLWVGLGVSYTQPNLILNPSVEGLGSCPDGGSGSFYFVDSWSPSNVSSPDYYHLCNTAPQLGVPYNALGYQYPRSDSAYFGLLFTNITGEYREAVQGKFSEKLQKGKKYCFEFYTVRANYYGYAMGEVGIYLSKDTIYAAMPSNNNALSPYSLINIDYLVDTLNWTKFSVEINNYEDDIQYFVFSNFQKGNEFDLKLVDSDVIDTTLLAAYYYFDDFALYDCGEADTLPDTVDTASINFPSVFTPNGDGINDVLHIDGLPPGSNLEVYNRWGDVVYKAYPYTEPWDGNKNGHPCPEGVYHYIVQLPDGQTVRKFVHLFR